LEYLRDQQQKPDQQLLDKLGWTPKDVRSFLDRWQRMKRQAAEPGPDAGQARRDLAEMLRSMGLRPSREQLRRDAGGTDEQRGLRDTGRRTIPPPAYRDQYDAYLKGTARSREE
jgi:hypothetical protein